MTYDNFRYDLENASATWFESKNFETMPDKPYILRKKTAWKNNLVLPEIYAYIMEKKDQRVNPFPLHNFLHHGLSSQAMLFNLLTPLVQSQKLGILAEPFEEVGISCPDKMYGEFEYSDRLVFNEFQTQPTSLDFAILDEDKNPQILIEAKLVEKDFGMCTRLQRNKCSGLNPLDGNGLERCYHVSIHREYWNVLFENYVLTGETIDGPTCPMAIFYQFYREVGFAVKINSKLVFLVDERNPYFSPNNEWSLPNKLIKTLRRKIRKNIKIVTIQRIFKEVEKYCHGQSWAKSFGEKYNISES